MLLIKFQLLFVQQIHNWFVSKNQMYSTSGWNIWLWRLNVKFGAKSNFMVFRSCGPIGKRSRCHLEVSDAPLFEPSQLYTDSVPGMCWLLDGHLLNDHRIGWWILQVLRNICSRIWSLIGWYIRGRHIENSDVWKHSILCQFCGFLSTVSSEVSVATLVFITVDRLICISFPFSWRKYTMSLTYR